jgi:hypothetical protein
MTERSRTATLLNSSAIEQQHGGHAEAQRMPAAAAAVGVAAAEVLMHLFADDAEVVHEVLTFYNFKLLSIIADETTLQKGRDWGAKVAAAIIADRKSDGAFQYPIFESYDPSKYPAGAFSHNPDPTAADPDGNQQAMYALHWGKVKPFGHASTASLPDILVEPLSFDYLQQFKEVAAYGRKDSPVRSADQTEIGVFWAYDGALRIGTPPRQYAQNVDVVVADRMRKGASKNLKTGYELAKLYAVEHVAMADSAIAVCLPPSR